MKWSVFRVDSAESTTKKLITEFAIKETGWMSVRGLCEPQKYQSELELWLNEGQLVNSGWEERVVPGT